MSIYRHKVLSSVLIRFTHLMDLGNLTYGSIFFLLLPGKSSFLTSSGWIKNK